MQSSIVGFFVGVISSPQDVSLGERGGKKLYPPVIPQSSHGGG